MSSVKTTRLMKELQELENCRPLDDNRLDILSAKIIGEPGTPYENGQFILRIEVPDQYPFEPPRVRFMTKIYHPNIDSEGRICLEILKPNNSAWRPTFNLNTVLIAVKGLMAEPNPDDPLDKDVAHEFLMSKERYLATARDWTEKYAKEAAENLGPDGSASIETSHEDVASSDNVGAAGNAGSSIGASAGGRMRSLFCSKVRVNETTDHEEQSSNDQQCSPTHDATDGTTKDGSQIDGTSTSSQKPKDTSGTPAKPAKPMSQSGSVNKSNPKPRSGKKKPKKTPNKSGGKKAEVKKTNVAPALQSKRPRMEDLFLDEDEEDIFVIN